VDARETAEIAALRDMFAAVPRDVSELLGVEALSLGDAFATRIRQVSGSTEINHALGISTAEQLARRWLASTGTHATPSRLLRGSTPTRSCGCADTSRATHG
jgi:hypothetical protein